MRKSKLGESKIVALLKETEFDTHLSEAVCNEQVVLYTTAHGHFIIDEVAKSLV